MLTGQVQAWIVARHRPFGYSVLQVRHSGLLRMPPIGCRMRLGGEWWMVTGMSGHTKVATVTFAKQSSLLANQCLLMPDGKYSFRANQRPIDLYDQTTLWTLLRAFKSPRVKWI